MWVLSVQQFKSAALDFYLIFLLTRPGCCLPLQQDRWLGKYHTCDPGCRKCIRWVDIFQSWPLTFRQGHRLTLLCILDCAAHLLPMPKEVETNFLHQTIKVFTKVSKQKSRQISHVPLAPTDVLPFAVSPSDGSSISPGRVFVHNTESHPESHPPRALPQSRSGGCWFLKLLGALRRPGRLQIQGSASHLRALLFSTRQFLLQVSRPSRGGGGSVWNV